MARVSNKQLQQEIKSLDSQIKELRGRIDSLNDFLHTLESRLDTQEKRFSNTASVFSHFYENEFKELKRKVEQIDSRLWYILITAVSTLASVLLSFLF